MRSFRNLALLMAVPAVAAVVMPGSAVAAPARLSQARLSHHHVVSVVGDGSRVSINHSALRAGRVTFSVRSTNSGDGSSITLFRPRRGHTLNEVFADLGEEFSPDPSTAANGTRDLVRDLHSYGLADVSPARGTLVTRTLRPGTYYLIDLGTPPTDGPPAVTTLTVKAHSGYRPAVAGRRVSATVKMTSRDTFKVSGSLPARGTIRVANVSDTLHFMSLERVKKGTTDKQVQQAFAADASGPPPWALSGPEMGTDVLTPGQALNLSYRLHPGTYVLVCFVADDKSGMPHAFMGMHKVVHLG